MEILKFTPSKSEGNYLGSVNMRMKIRYFDGIDWIEDVVTINEITIYKNKFGKRFINFPYRTFEVNGEKKYFHYNHLAVKEKFEHALLNYLDKYQETLKTQDAQQEDVPF